MHMDTRANNILAPTQLWKDYDPYSEPLRPSYLKFEEEENYYVVAAYINGDKYGSQYTRIFIYGYMPKQTNFNTNIVFINDVMDQTFSIDNLKTIYLKYGQFYLTMIVDPQKFENLELKDLLIEQIELLDKTFVKTYDDLKNFLLKFNIIGDKIKNALNL